MSCNLDLSFAHVISYSSGHLDSTQQKKLLFHQFQRRNIAMNSHLLTFLVILALFSQARGFCGEERDFSTDLMSSHNSASVI